MKNKSQKEKMICYRNHLPIKISIVFLMLCFFNGKANTSYGQTEKVDLSVKSGPLSQVFQQIENQTDYHFFYNSKEVNPSEKVHVEANNQKLSRVLHHIFDNKDLTYTILDHQIIIKKADNQTTKIGLQPFVQQQRDTIKGVVTDKNNVPLSGVSVLVEGTKRGTVTNFDGEYKIAVDRENNTALKFVFLGFKPALIEIKDHHTINVALKEDLAQLKDVVLIGYGEQKREDVSGAVSSVDTDELIKTSTGDVGFERGLGGLVKGVRVSQNSGRPGAPIRLNIRGVTSPLSSLAGSGGGLNQPLYVIDGVPFNTESVPGSNPLLTIDPDNIESFDILKDAAATSIYGSRGANGVIIIKTKKGKRNEAPTVNLSYTSSFAKPVNTVDVLNASQYKDFYRMMLKNSTQAINSGKLDPFFAFDLQNLGDIDFDPATGQANYNGLNSAYFGDANTDWNDEVFRNVAVTNKVNFNMRGGTAKTNYSLSLSYMDQDGVVIRDNFKKYNLSTSINTELSKRIDVGGTVNFSHTKSKSGEEDVLQQYNVNTSVVRARPDLPVRDDNGQLFPQEDYSNGFQTFEPNPVMRLQNDQEDKAYSFIGNAFVEVEPIKKLKIKADVNTAIFYSDNHTFIPKIAQTDMVMFPTTSLLSEASSLKSNVVTNLTANYNFRFGNHNFNAMAGFAWDRTKTKTNSYFYSGFPDDEILTNPSSAEEILSYTGNEVENGLNSIFGRLTYNYEGKYNATVNFRTDKSSKFGPSNKRAYFPSISLGWDMAKEDFLAENEKVNTLKLRASYGKVGSTNVANFAYLQFLNTSASDIYNGQTAVIPNNIFPNEDIGWETTKELNLGLDFEFFNSRLRGSIDAYRRKTDGALVTTPIPLELGPSTYFANFVDVSNKGLEVSVGGDIIKTQDFTWSAKANWSLNRNKLDKIKGADINQYQLDYFVEGEPVGTIKGYKVKKIIQSQDEIDQLNANSPTGVYDKSVTGVGDYLYEDLNGDGRITSDDREVIGDIEPDYFGGISTTFSYKNFSLFALFQYSVGAETVWQGIPNGVSNILGSNKYAEYANNTWTPENRDARYAKAVYFDPAGDGRISDRYLFSTSYLRFKSFQISYNFNPKTIESLGLDQLRLTLSGNNLVTWTKWPGLDPETFSERGSITSQTSNEDPYPLSRSFSIGVNVQF